MRRACCGWRPWWAWALALASGPRDWRSGRWRRGSGHSETPTVGWSLARSPPARKTPAHFSPKHSWARPAESAFFIVYTVQNLIFDPGRGPWRRPGRRLFDRSPGRGSWARGCARGAGPGCPKCARGAVCPLDRFVSLRHRRREKHPVNVAVRVGRESGSGSIVFLCGLGSPGSDRGQ